MSLPARGGTGGEDGMGTAFPEKSRASGKFETATVSI
jgi:hypothetical protein